MEASDPDMDNVSESAAECSFVLFYLTFVKCFKST